MRLKKSKEGYLLVDHRASPGLPEEVAKESGFDPAMCRGGKMYEDASYTCAHCGGVTPKYVYVGKEYAECIKCNHYICDQCAVLAYQPNYVHMSLREFVDKSADYAAHTGMPFGTNAKLLMS